MLDAGKRTDAGPFVCSIGAGMVHVRLQVLIRVSQFTISYIPLVDVSPYLNMNLSLSPFHTNASVYPHLRMRTGCDS